METKYVRVPFNFELAKEITNGKKEGRIVTRGGKNARIVCFDAKNDFNIITLLTNEKGEEFSFSYNNYGEDRMPEQNDDDLMLEIPEYMTFKDGDVIAYDNFDTISITKADLIRNVKDTFAHYHAELRNGRLHFYEEHVRDVISVGARLATEEEKQKLIYALKQSDDPRAKECLKKLGIEEPKCNFKPFDKVLVRNSDDMQWGARFFDRVFEGCYACTDSLCYKQCIPFNEETEHLIGTTKSFEK